MYIFTIFRYIYWYWYPVLWYSTLLLYRYPGTLYQLNPRSFYFIIVR